jgi:hypothetical protein
MRPRTLIVAALSALALLACTGDDLSSTPVATSSDPSPPPTEDPGDVPFVEGEYTYDNQGVVVSLSLDGVTGTLMVENGGESELGPPGLYAFTPSQERVDAEVTPADVTAPGAEATFEVAFPDDLDPADMGLVALLFGDSNWGALSPVPEGT